MSVIKNKNNYRSGLEYRKYVDRLIAELNKDASSTPILDNTIIEPVIHENYVGNTSRFSVTVIWEVWEDVDFQERNKIVMDAYEHSDRKGDLLNINSVFSFTPLQAETLGVTQ